MNLFGAVYAKTGQGSLYSGAGWSFNRPPGGGNLTPRRIVGAGQTGPVRSPSGLVPRREEVVYTYVGECGYQRKLDRAVSNARPFRCPSVRCRARPAKVSGFSGISLGAAKTIRLRSR
jgi:hypothetical protein